MIKLIKTIKNITLFFVANLTFFLLLGIIIVLGSNLLILKSTKNLIYKNIEELPENKVCLILGTSSRIRGNINPYFKNRIEAAVSLFKEGKVKYILVSGDNRSKYYNEPEDMRKALIKSGIPKRNIYQDFAGLRTLDSVFRAKSIFGQKSFTIVTDGFHLSRALYLAKSKKIDAVGYPCKVYKKFNKVVLREYIARVKAILDLYILNTKPRFGGEKIFIGKKNELSQDIVEK